MCVCRKEKERKICLKNIEKLMTFSTCPNLLKLMYFFSFLTQSKVGLLVPLRATVNYIFHYKRHHEFLMTLKKKKNSVCVSKLGAACNKKSHLKRISISNVISVVRHPNRKAVLFISNSFLYAKSIHFCLTKP